MQASRMAALLAMMLFASSVSSVEAMKLEDDRRARERGRLLYERACLWCHGVDGRGDGPAGWFLGRYEAPRPRDFVSEGFKFRSTPSGTLPSDQDLFRTVTRGITGVMPPFGSLSEADRWDIISYIKSFNPSFLSQPPVPLAIPLPAIPASDESIKKGRLLYLESGCQGCHGENGTGRRGSGKRDDMTDARGLTIRPPDLTAPSSFKNGADPRDIYRTLVTGLDGTPMPSYAHNFEGQEENLWHLVNYILSLAPGSLR